MKPPKLTISYDNGLGVVSTLSVEGIDERHVAEYLQSDAVLCALGFIPHGGQS